jgi:hypothetical protein
MYVASGGDYVCPSSLPGEAAVHRVAAAPPVAPKSKPILSPLASGVLSFAAGRLVGNALFNHKPKTAPVPFVQSDDPVQNTANFFNSRG